jgi:hypothetical protein
MTGRGAVCTIIAKNYLAQARCLMDSVAQFHPELDRIVILVDRADDYFDPLGERFTIVRSDALEIPDSKWFHFKYTLLELSTAVKPYVVDHLFRKLGFDFVLFLDPDILVCSELVEVLDGLREHSLILTPHLTAPMHDDKRPCELDILRSGVYNLGFFAMRRNDETLRFVQWWKERLYDYCVIDLPRGLFLDQRWAEFAPSFVSRVCILRDASYNVAYWNLQHRQISLSHGTFLVNGSPLRFFHFSGYDPDHPDRLSKHQNRHRIEELPALQALVQQYSKLLYGYGYRDSCRWPYAYGSFDNGSRIPDFGRPLHLESPEVTRRIRDPFSAEGYEACVQIWNEPLARDPKLPHLTYRLYRANSDLQTAMPDVFHGDYRQFVRWLTSVGAKDHDLPDLFLESFRGVAQQLPGDDGPSQPAPGAPIQLTRLAHQIYDKRPDLQAFFPDPSGEDAPKYLAWLLSYGKRQYALSDVHLSTLRRQWNAEVDRLPTFRARARYRLLLAASMASAAVTPAFGHLLRIPSSLLARPARRVD